MNFAFDTLAYVRRLRDAKVPPEQAEAMADALAQTFNAPNGVATKSDIVVLEASITLLKWMIGANTAMLVAVLARLFIR
jgi:hypothetical protein